MSRLHPPLMVAAFVVFAARAPQAQAQERPLPCSLTSITTIRMPVGPARFQSGRIFLDDGAVLELSGSPQSAEVNIVRLMKAGDPVAMCFGPLRTYADAGESRTITVLDRRSGAYYGTLVGSLKGDRSSHQ